MDELKQRVRDAVRDEITRQVNQPAQKQDEEEPSLEEGFKANAIRTLFMSSAFLTLIGGAFAAVGTMSPGTLVAAMAGGAGLMAAGEVIARKTAFKEFESIFNELQRAVAARDRFIEQASQMDSPEEAEMYLDKHKIEITRLTKEQKRVAKKMRKAISTERTSQDTARILGSLTARDRKYIEDLIEKAESGLITMIDVK